MMWRAAKNREGGKERKEKRVKKEPRRKTRIREEKREKDTAKRVSKGEWIQQAEIQKNSAHP